MQLQTLSNDQLRVLSPSAFAAAAHESRSDRYAYIPTINVIDAMRAEGFMPVSAGQSRTRIAGKSDFTKHMIRFRRDDLANAVTRALGDVSAEVVMVNSHDGTSAYNLIAGLWRLWCLNGAVASMGEIGQVKVQHSGKIVDKVIEGSYRVIEGARLAIEHAKAWSGVQLTDGEVLAFGKAAGALRYDPVTQPVNAEQMVRVRRDTDKSNDLWTVFNRGVF